jgi:SAM-dependent methyltransferase
LSKKEMSKETVLLRVCGPKVVDRLRRIKRSVFHHNRYDPQRYWSDQLGRFGSELRGPGHGGLSEEDNVRLYKHGEQALERLTRELGITWDGHFAEIGPGNGYWLRWLRQRGVHHYTGFDVTDVLFPFIHQEYPDATLLRRDVTRHRLPGKFDVILMIDVTQHIVVEKKFQRAMKNCAEAMKDGGHFIVSSWLRPYLKFSDAEVMRPLELYTELFCGWKLTGPISFRDKHIMAFTKRIM